jgi:hypothetical protein
VTFVRTLIVVFSLMIPSCCHVPRPSMGADSTSALVDLLRARNQAQPTARGELQVDHFAPEGRIAGKVYAFSAAGGRLRLEAVSPLDTPVRTMAVDGEHLSIVDQESRRCLEGRADPCLVGQAVGVELSAVQVATTLTGGVPILRHRDATSRWNDCGWYEVELRGEAEGWSERIRLAPVDGRLVPVHAVIRDRDGVVLEMDLAGHAPAGDLIVAWRMVIRMPRSEAELRVEWRHIEVGVELPERAWRTTCPAGFTVEPATCSPSTPLSVLEEPAPPPVEPAPDAGPPDAEPGAGSDLTEELGL